MGHNVDYLVEILFSPRTHYSFSDPFEEYKANLANRMKRERGDYAEEERKARMKANKEKNRTTW